MLQGVAGDCNSPEATHAWFDSRVAHHFTNTVSNRGLGRGLIGLLRRKSICRLKFHHPFRVGLDCRKVIRDPQKPDARCEVFELATAQLGQAAFKGFHHMAIGARRAGPGCIGTNHFELVHCPLIARHLLHLAQPCDRDGRQADVGHGTPFACQPGRLAIGAGPVPFRVIGAVRHILAEIPQISLRIFDLRGPDAKSPELSAGPPVGLSCPWADGI